VSFLILVILSMVTKCIRSQAPTRIDLGGGTLDIWPLYLLLENPVTFNVAIDLFAEAILEEGSFPSEVELIAEDQNQGLSCSWHELRSHSLSLPPELALHFRLLRFFEPKKKKNGASIRLTTRALSPAGAGLGGSSALGIAMAGALSAWAEYPVDPKTLIAITCDIESAVIRVPAGLQDYHAATYGGLQAIHWEPGSHRHERLSESLLQEMQKRLILFYSGKSRNSGINNWTLFKEYIDQEKKGGSSSIALRFQKIADTTHQLIEAAKKSQWDEVGLAIAQEWEIRKTLASEISIPEIDCAYAQAQKLTRVYGKICGAGGGGCFFLYLPEPPSAEIQRKLIAIFQNHGIESLPFHLVSRGLEVN